ncbi:transposase [Hallerella succinigenes]|uniref:transposase n=1 Tax=Hallerella succinigenes TaxID=1896222 RepID=UPI003899E506
MLTRVGGVFPNPESCERLVGSLLMEQHDEWMEEKAYFLTEKEMEMSAFCA